MIVLFRLACVLACCLLCSLSALADELPAEPTADSSVVDAVEITEDVQDGTITAAIPAAEMDANNDETIVDDDSDNLDVDDSTTDAITVDSLTINADSVMLSSAADDNTYPADAPLMGGLYIECSTAELGDILIYIPPDYQYRSFSKTTGGVPVNITQSTITGYSYNGNAYYVRWASFGQAQYRAVTSSGYGSSYADLNITDIKNTNVVFVESAEDLPVVPDNDMTNIIVVFMLGVIVLCLFIKRF